MADTRAQKQGVVFVWGEDDTLFEAEQLPPKEFVALEGAPSLERNPIVTDVPVDIQIDAELLENDVGPRRTMRRRSTHTSARGLQHQEESVAPPEAGEALAEGTLDDSEEQERRVSLEEAELNTFNLKQDEDGFWQPKKSRSSRQRKPRAEQPKRSLFAQAVDCLSRREYSRAELRKRLMRDARDEEREALAAEVDQVIERLEGLGYLSDKRFAEGRVRMRASQLGNARIRGELRRLGVGEEAIREAMDELTEAEDVRAWRVWKKRFSELPTSAKERDRQIRYLLYRGFSMSAVERVIRGRVEPPEEQGFWD